MLGVSFRDTGSWLPRVMLYAFLLTLATTALRPMVSYRALELGGGALDLGILAASFGILSLLAAVPLGRRLDRWGEPRVMLAGAALVFAAAVALLVVDTIAGLAVCQAALGLGQVMTVMGNQAIIANGGDNQGRDGRYGLFTAVISLGQLAGPALAGVIAGDGPAPAPGEAAVVDTGTVFAVMAVLCAVAVAVATTVLLRPPPGDRQRRLEAAAATRPGSFAAMGQVVRLRSMPQAMIVSLTVLTGIDLLAVYLPAYGAENGLSVQTVGYLLAVRAAASIASRLLMVVLIRAVGRRWLLILSLVCPAVALAVFPLVPLAGQYLAMVVIGLGLGLGQPVTLSWVAAQAPRHLLGTALGIRLTGNRLGQVVVPLVIGTFAAATGVGAVFAALAALLAASGAMLLGSSFDDDPRDDPGRQAP